MTIVYIIGGIYMANGMSDVMTRKVNWLALHTDAKLHVVLTERPDLPPLYKLEPSVEVVNFDLGFDRLDTLPLWRKAMLYRRLMRRYRRCLTDYLMQLGPDIVVTALRRDINFLTDIGDGSRKIGELHFARSSYRVFSKPWLPAWVNAFVTRRWQASLVSKLRRLDTFIVLSHEDADAWPELRDNIIVIPNSIRQPATHALRREGHAEGGIVLAAGRYTYQKGFDLLLQSWANIEPMAPAWHLHVFGSGDPTPYAAQARQLGLRHVELHPATQDLRAEMLRSDIFAFSSRYEGFGLVLAEAMACGCAVVSYACPCGPRDIVTHGRDGLLVDKVGDTEAFADALLSLIADPERRRRLAAAATESARRYDEDTVMQQWCSVLKVECRRSLAM